MEIPETIEKITFFGATSDLDIYLKQFFFKNNETHWIRIREKVKKGANTLCLCNWKSYKSTLYIQYNKYIDISLTQLETTNTNHLYVSVSQFGKIKKLSELCLETIKIQKIPLTYIRKLTYLRETDLLSTNNVTVYLMTEYGNETSSCKTKKPLDINLLLS
jgi:hypothetical protein